MRHHSTLNMQSILAIALLFVLPSMAMAFTEGNPYSITGSQQLSDLDLVLASNDDVQADALASTARLDNVDAASSVASLLLEEALADEWQDGDVYFIDYAVNGKDMFKVRFMKSVPPNTTVSFSNFDMTNGTASPSGKGALNLTFKKGYPCGTPFTFNGLGGQWRVSEGWSYQEELDLTDALVESGDFALDGKGTNVYAFVRSLSIATGGIEGGSIESRDAANDAKLIRKGVVGEYDDAEASCDPADVSYAATQSVAPADQGQPNEALNSMRVPDTDCTTDGDFVPDDFCDNCGGTGCTLANTFTNPVLTASCNELDILLILDESGSINTTLRTEVRNGVIAFIEGLKCKGASIMAIEFSPNARFILDGGVPTAANPATPLSGYLPVDDALETAFLSYFDNVPTTSPLLAQNNDASYSPSGLTNYQAAFLAMHDFIEQNPLAGAPDLVLFFTDGNPTAFFVTGASLPNYQSASNTSCSGTAATRNATLITNRYKCPTFGTHFFAAGVAGATASVLQQITGPLNFTTTNNLTNTDYAIGAGAQLEDAFILFAEELCPINPEESQTVVCAGSQTASISVEIPADLAANGYTYTYTQDGGDVQGPFGPLTDETLVVSGLPAGTYVITVNLTFSAGCSTPIELDAVIIPDGNAPDAEATVTDMSDPTCGTLMDGEIEVTFGVGSAPYTLTINGGGPIVTNDNPYTFTGLMPGSYDITAQDANMCNTVNLNGNVLANTECCPTACAVSTTDPTTDICPGTVTSFAADVTGNCLGGTIEYTWAIVNSGGANATFTVPPTTASTSVTVDAGDDCGSYEVTLSILCTADVCSTLVCTSFQNVTISVPTLQPVTCPQEETIGACASQELINLAISEWVANFSETAPQGCNTNLSYSLNLFGSYTRDELSDALLLYFESVACNADGLAAVVGCTITDDCNESQTCATTFTVTGYTAINPQDVTCPPDPAAVSACDNPDGTIANAVTAWVNSFDFDVSDINGCSPQLSYSVDGSGMYTEPLELAIAIGDAASALECDESGGTIVVECSVTDQCLDQPITCSSTFTVTGYTPIDPQDVTCPPNPTPVSACDDPNFVIVAVSDWLLQFDFDVSDINGCSPTVSYSVNGQGMYTSQIDLENAVFPLILGLACNENGGTIEIECTVTDLCLDVPLTCMSTFTVDGYTLPLISCPNFLTIECDESTDPSNTGSATSQFGCGDVTRSFTDREEEENEQDECADYTIYRKWLVVDDCGNRASCTQEIYVSDTKEPVLVRPGDVMILCDESTDPSNTGEATATDACDPNLGEPTFTDRREDGSCAQEYTLYRAWTITDACDNTAITTQIIMVKDDEAPVRISPCPEGLVLNCEDDIPAGSANDVTFEDNCSTFDVFYSEESTQDPDETTCEYYTYEITRKWSAVDACGNPSTTCVQVIMIQDTMRPVIGHTKPNIIQTCLTEEQIPVFEDLVEFGAILNYDDNCDENPKFNSLGFADVQIINPNEPCLLGRQFFFEGVDACGNVSEPDTVIVRYRLLPTPPEIIPGPATDLGCDGSDFPSDLEIGTVPSPYFDIGLDPESCYSDNFSVSILRKDTVVQECDTLVFVRLRVIEELCNTQDDGTIIFRWRNDQPIVAVCPQDLVLECADEDNDALIATWLTTYSADDVCSPVVTSNDYPNGAVTEECGDTYTQVVTFTAMDTCGNMVSCTAKIIVTDTTPPTASCTEDKNVECSDYDENTSFDAPTGTDLCGGVTITMTSTTPALDECGLGTVTRKWELKDDCGNTTTCSQVITIEDTTDPVIECVMDVTIECPDDPFAAFTAPTATDNCPVEAIQFGGGIETRGVDPMYPMVTFLRDEDNRDEECGTGTITRYWIAEDCVGNTATCSQVVTIEDTTEPVITCADDKTVECSDYPQVEDFDVPTAVDACDGPLDVMISRPDLEDLDDCGNGTITRYWKAVDCFGNSATCSQVITIEDTTDPVITCAADKTVECSDYPGVSDFETPTATDNCTDVEDITISVSRPDLEELDECGNGTITRYWKAVDCTGNSATCSQVITLEDTTDPMISCSADITVECDVFSTEGSALFTNPTISDNCDPNPIVDVVETITTVNECGVGTSVRKWEVVDCTGNTATCSQKITIVDTQEPVIVCVADVTVECDETDPRAAFTMPTATDNCPVDLMNPIGGVDQRVPVDAYPFVSFLRDEDNLDDCGTGTITRYWQAEDCVGNTATCSQVVTIVDTTDPVITCANDKTVECSDYPQVVDFDVPTAVDVCDGPLDVMMSRDDLVELDDCGTGTVTRYWKAVDCTGNSATCSQVITIEDTTDPVITCVPGFTVECGHYSDDLFTDPTISDNCAICDLQPGVQGGAMRADVECIWPQIVSMEIIRDLDACGTGTVTKRWVASDCSGNTATCSQVITIEDTTAPEITCVADKTIECDVVPAEGQFDVPSATDNCDAAPSITMLRTENNNGECNGTGTITRYWIAEDCTGNTATCSQVLTIVDTTDPMIVCGDTLMVECDDPMLDAKIADWLATSYTASDNCGNVTVNTMLGAITPGCGPQTYFQTVTFTAEDACGNTASCTSVIAVIDTTGPVVGHMKPPIIQCVDGEEDLPSFEDLIEGGNLSYDDNCGVVENFVFLGTFDTTAFSPNFPCLRARVFAFTGVDECGNLGNIDFISVRYVPKPAPPLLITENYPDLGCEGGDNIPSIQQLIDEGYVEVVGQEGSCYGGFSITVGQPQTIVTECDTILRIPFRGIEELCQQNSTTDGFVDITWRRDREIEQMCPQDLVLECADENNDALIAAWLTTYSATDVCSPVVTSNDYATGTPVQECGNTSYQVVTFMAQDTCGNMAACTARIIIEDTTGPMVDCPDDLTVECGDDLSVENPEIAAWLGSASGTDLCGDVTLDSTDYDDAPFTADCGATGEFVVTFYLSDECGNVSSCTSKLIIEDTTDPVVTCPADLEIECGEILEIEGEGANEEILAWLGAASGTDDCGTVSLDSTSYDPSDFTDECGETGEQVVTFYLSDECENVATCVATIKVVDTTDPVVDCPDDLTIECGDDLTENNGRISAWLGAASGTDDCGTVSLDSTSYDPSDFSDECGETGEQVVTFYLSDECGNVASCTASIIIVDTTDPVITCPLDLTIECGTSYDDVLATATDICDSDTVTITFEDEILPGNCGEPGGKVREIVVRRFVAEDDCGNTSSCTTVITIEDTTPPVISCPDDATVQCVDGTPLAELIHPDITGFPTIQDQNVCPDEPTYIFFNTNIVEVPCSTIVTRVWSVTDQCGNGDSSDSTICAQTIYIVDTEAPTIVCPADATIGCNDEIPMDGLSATDRCDVELAAPTVLRIDTTGSCPFVLTVVYTASDACGNTATCTQTVTVIDEDGPTVMCPDDLTLECGESLTPALNAELSAWLASATAMDLCGDAAITSTSYDSTAFVDEECISTQVVTFFAMDECGNVGSCTATIVIVDTTPPDVMCVEFTMDLECNENLVIPVLPPVWTDNCGDATVTFTDRVTGGTCPVVEQIFRKWKVEDDCGNATTCTQLIKIVDTTSPDLTCPPDMTIECEDLPTTDLGFATATDACSGVIPSDSIKLVDEVIEQIDECSYFIFRFFEATDVCGNGGSSQGNLCQQTITVVDNVGPEITVPGDLTAECGEALPTGNATAVDACDTSAIIPTWIDGEAVDIDECVQRVTRTYSAADACGNVTMATQYIFIEDTTAPVLDCMPSTVTVECGDDLPDTTPTATDVCDADVEIMVMESDPEFGACGGMVTRVYIAKDDCGNTASCTVTILIVDTTPPMITCPDPLVLDCQFDEESAAGWLDSGTATDVCDGAVAVSSEIVNFEPGCDENTGIYTYKFSAADACGNVATCFSTIVVQDTVAPQIVGGCPLDEILDCDQGLVCIDFDGQTADAPITSVMAGGVTVSIEAYAKGVANAEAWIFNTSNPNTGDEDLGTPNILFGGPGINGTTLPDAFNASNNNAQGNAVVVQNPNNNVADDFFLSDTLIFRFSEPVFLQSMVTVDFEPNQASSGAGAYLIDENGNETFVQWMGSQDNGQEEVNFNAFGIVTLKVYFGLGTDAIQSTSGAVSRICFDLVDKPEVVWTDNCGGEIQDTCIQELITNDDCNAVFKNTFYAFDACGNASDTCVQQVTLGIDAIRPIAECPPNEFYDCDATLPDPDPSLVFATDNCTASENLIVAWVEDIPFALDENGTCENPAVLRIYSVTDECGNVALCSQFLIPFENEIELDADVLLDAALQPGTTTMLPKINSILPTAQPYNAAPFGYGGGETLGSIPADMVDWVLVELVDTTTGDVFGARAGYVNTAGEVLDTNGQNLKFFAPATFWKVIIRHRNHLDIISDVNVDFSSGVGTFSFIDDWSAAPMGMKSVGGSNYAMYLGDVNADNVVSYNVGFSDRISVLLAVGFATPNNTVPGYLPTDANFDGVTSYNVGLSDRISILLQVGFATPNNVISGQNP